MSVDDSKNNVFTLKEWAKEDKPREKLMALGKKKLSNAELIAILLGSGSKGESAVSLAKRILNSANNDLNELRNHGINELSGFKGMGEAKAITLIAAMELGYRLINSNSQQKENLIRNSQDFFDYIAPLVVDLKHEEFWAIYLNIRNKIIGKKLIAKGGSTETSVDIREVFSEGLTLGANSVAVVHNHPSGNLSPSKQDINLTQRLLEAGKILRINLIEHLIIGILPDGSPSYYSFFDEGNVII